MSLHLESGLQPVAGYTLVRMLGRGGFGEVWEALAPGGVRVALKFIRLGTIQAGAEQRALEIIRDIRHPHLLDVQFAARVDDCLVIAMPLCDESLMDHLRACQAKGLPGVPRDELLGYMEEVARAVDFLNEPRHPAEDGHLVGVQHRDIKPHNIFLVGGSARLADFGLAKVLESTSTSHTGAMSPNYVAPEVLQRRVSQHSDQYSLAVAYVQLRTGRLPFAGETVDQILYAHVHDDPDLSGLPEAERPVVARALAKQPEQRWPCCRAFVAGLEAAPAAASGPLAATRRSTLMPDTLVEKDVPAVLRRFRAIALGGIVIGLVILATLLLYPRFATTFPQARPVKTERVVLAAIRDHLRTAREADRPFLRYFTLHNLHNNKTVSDDDLRLGRAAVAKLVNILSWKAAITVPAVIDGEQTVLALDVRDVGWDERDLWREILGKYPYGLTHDKDREESVRTMASEVYALSGTSLPFIRADWFVATASRPPLYDTILTKEAMDRLVDRDRAMFLKALDEAVDGFLKAGEDRGKTIREFPEPIGAVASAYWKDLGSEAVAAELGLGDPKDLVVMIKANARLGQLGLAPLIQGATIKRIEWESLLQRSRSTFQQVAQELRLGTPIRAL